MKKIKKDIDFSEKDIETTIKYLKTIKPQESTREYAIKLLKGMKLTAHIIAHDKVDKEKVNKSK